MQGRDPVCEPGPDRRGRVQEGQEAEGRRSKEVDDQLDFQRARAYPQNIHGVIFIRVAPDTELAGYPAE